MPPFNKPIPITAPTTACELETGTKGIEGKNIVIHCMGGKGRSGTIAAILLIEFGEDNKKAIEIVREKRKGAIETEEQEKFILNYNRIK